jgi:cysteine desulfurase
MPAVSEVTYLDHAATTPLRPEVGRAMADVHAEPLGNPTGSHRSAQRARRLLEEARDEIAALVGFEPGEIVFTSGGTESANLAVFGPLTAGGPPPGDPPVLLYSAVEHPAVLESCRAAAAQGLAQAVALPVDPAGRVDLGALAAALGPRTALVAVMAANNETGVLQPLGQVVTAVRASGAPARVFSDAVQAAPFVDLARACAGVDLVGLSAHKIGGPVGVGVLGVRSTVALAPHMHGGGQERERRSGTQDVAGAVGLAVALHLAATERVEAARAVAERRDRLAAGLASVPGTHRTVPGSVPTLPGHLHLCWEGVAREELLVSLGQVGLCASGGSSCASGALQESHVLAAMGLPADLARGAIRFTLGPATTDEDIARALAAVPAAVAALRRRP